jgi:hypothetical protein
LRLPVFFPPLSPRLVPVAVPASARAAPPDTPAWQATCLFFRPSKNFPRRWPEEPPRDPPPPEEKPLSPTEQFLYVAFAIWVGLTFLALFVVVILLHSPINAN